MSNGFDGHLRNKDAVNNLINNKEVGKFEVTKEIAINMTALLAVGLIVFGLLFTAFYTGCPKNNFLRHLEVLRISNTRS